MGNNRPVKTKCFIKYLEHLGFEAKRTKGSHTQYTKRGYRTIPVREEYKDIPALHIKTSCRTLGIEIQVVYDWIKNNC